jgi:bifunctional enzyme CysN/CysC
VKPASESLTMPDSIPDHIYIHPKSERRTGGAEGGEPEKMKFVVVGHVDHGKSTLIGRLLFDTETVALGKAEAIRTACEAEGMEFEYAFLLDALLEEQEQNITIDTTQIPFKTARRSYMIIDAPGHKEFVKNMMTGAASAEAAILMVDAREGVQEQSRRHGYLLSMLGIRQVILAVNKMDLVDFSQARFEEVAKEFHAFLEPLGVVPTHTIPVSARNGHNITTVSEEMPWFAGPAILEALDSFIPRPAGDDLPLRLVVQDIYRFDERRIIAGRIESGELHRGDEIVFWPDGKRSKVRSIEAWGADQAPTRAGAGESVAITLEEQIFAERGQIASHVANAPVEAREFSAKLFWLDNEPLEIGRPLILRLCTQECEARVTAIESVFDSSTMRLEKGSRTQLERYEVGEVTIRVRRPIAFDNAEVIPVAGRFVLMHGPRIGGGGIVFGADYGSARAEVASDNLTWTVSPVTREARAEHLGHRGAVLWFTGLSGSGKSTLATGLDFYLHRRGIAATILDGDNLRHGLCSNLGFSPDDRSENIRRAGETAKLMAEAGLVVICSLISPYREDRHRVREICARDGVPFAEVFINAPLEICESRDPRGLYKKARAGEISNFTGIGSPYEAPENPEIEVRTDELTPEKALAVLLDYALGIARFTPESQPGQLVGGEGI